MADIFISYKTERRAVAEHLADILEDHGYSVWYDYAMLSGRDFARQIEAELEAAQVVLVLWCDLSVDSDWVRSEARYAKATGKLLPSLVTDCTLPVEFNGDQARDLRQWTGEPVPYQPRVLLDDIAERLDRA
ncbi:MAG: toll/interleukin-1 receptor domain-containing protein, partial [Pseudomonadota bacterium]